MSSVFHFFPLVLCLCGGFWVGTVTQISRVWQIPPEVGKEETATPSDWFANVTYSQLRDKILENYFAGETKHENDLDYILEKSLHAMRYVENEGEPSKVVGFPYLYIGGVGECSMCNLTLFMHNISQFTRVVILCQTLSA